MKQPHTWGLALSGGAARGLSGIGILEVLQQEGFRPDYVSGSSMGAIVGALFAMGHSCNTMRTIAESLHPLSIARVSTSPLSGGLHGGIFRQCLHEHLSEYLGTARIGDCHIPFVCIAGRVKEPIAWQRILQDGFASYASTCIEKYVFPSHTLLIDAIMASSAIPIVFSPVSIDGDTFVDLVTFGSIPARSLREQYHPTVLIGTDANASFDSFRRILPSSWRQFLEEGEREQERSRSECDLIIKPTIRYGQYRFDKAVECIDAGNDAAQKALPSIRALLASAGITPSALQP